MRTLWQAIAADGVVPFLGPFATVAENGEPRRALLLTTALCLVFAMIGSLNAVAPLVSICFLTCYSALNLSCLVLSVVNAPRYLKPPHLAFIICPISSIPPLQLVYQQFESNVRYTCMV